MKTCSYCSHPNADDRSKCDICGRPLAVSQRSQGSVAVPMQAAQGKSVKKLSLTDRHTSSLCEKDLNVLAWVWLVLSIVGALWLFITHITQIWIPLQGLGILLALASGFIGFVGFTVFRALASMLVHQQAAEYAAVYAANLLIDQQAQRESEKSQGA